jgi:hypothetical protein
VYSTAHGPAVSVARPRRVPRPSASSRRPVTHCTSFVTQHTSCRIGSDACTLDFEICALRAVCDGPERRPWTWHSCVGTCTPSPTRPEGRRPPAKGRCSTECNGSLYAALCFNFCCSCVMIRDRVFLFDSSSSAELNFAAYIKPYPIVQLLFKCPDVMSFSFDSSAEFRIRPSFHKLTERLRESGLGKKAFRPGKVGTGRQ